MRFRSVLVLGVLCLSTAGCAMSGTGVGVAEPFVAPVPGVAEGGAMAFPECQTGDYAFQGESTLAAIGLGEVAGGPDATRVGMIWVTAGPASFDVPQPLPAVEEGKGGEVVDARMVCVQWPDGSGMASNISDDWVPPASVTGTAAAVEGWSGPPVGVLVLIGGAAVLIGVSVLAFRREGV